MSKMSDFCYLQKPRITERFQNPLLRSREALVNLGIVRVDCKDSKWTNLVCGRILNLHPYKCQASSVG